MKTGKTTKWDSVPDNKVARYFPEGTVVGQTHKWALNSCSNLHELDAQLSRPHQNTIKRKKTTPESVSLTPFMEVAAGLKEFFCLCDPIKRLWLFRQSLESEGESSQVQLGQRERGDIAKKVMNGKADCFTILKRISRLKCVSSGFRSSTFSKMGSLKWVHGTMSNRPCNHTWLSIPGIIEIMNRNLTTKFQIHKIKEQKPDGQDTK